MKNKISQHIDVATEQAKWKQLAEDILQYAKKQNVTQAEVGIGNSIGFSVNVRMGDVETVEYNRDKSVDITVYFNHKKGSATTTDISKTAIQNTIDAACRIAQLGNEDSCAGLADAHLMATNYPDLNLHHPWSIDTEQAIVLALDCENQARAYDKRITNSEGANVSTRQSVYTYANTHGFIGSYATSRHDLSCTLVAQDSNGMQRDYGYTAARDPADLKAITWVAQEAAERTVRRLNARRIKTCETPVIFHASIASGLLRSFLAAISGGNLYRQSSFLVEHLNKPVFAPHINIAERPHLVKGWASSPFDNEGVMTHDRELVVDGVLQGYLLSSYSARRLGMQTTGNAGGAHNILINTSHYDLPELIKQMQKGLLVTELLGQGVNLVTGDYSRGAAGFWIENGEIQYPVEEITIAGNLRDMFKQIALIGSDIDTRHSILTGSILIEKMMVAGE